MAFYSKMITNSISLSKVFTFDRMFPVWLSLWELFLQFFILFYVNENVDFSSTSFPHHLFGKKFECDLFKIILLPKNVVSCKYAPHTPHTPHSI